MQRAWADWKQVGTKHQASLGPEKCKMQATLHGTYCTQLAALKIKDKIKKNMVVAAWYDDEFMKAGLKSWGVNVEEYEQKKTVEPGKVYCAFLEDWERKDIRNKDILSKNRLLKKHAGMSWQDPDSTPLTYALVMASSLKLEWK